jgi:hypothetical protein
MTSQWHGSRSAVRSSTSAHGAKSLTGSSGCRNFGTKLCVLSCIVFAVLFFGGCENKNVSAAPAPPTNVQVIEVVQRDVPIYHEYLASMDGFVNAQIQPQVSGYLIKQNYLEGALVAKNQESILDPSKPS